MSKRIVILGTSFAGFTAAIELGNALKGRHEVVVVSPQSDFVFIPSLIWYPFGLRTADDIRFDVRPIYAKHHVTFVHQAAQWMDLPKRTVHLADGSTLPYDYLLVATGPHVDFDSIPGLGPKHHSVSICNLPHAEQAKTAWERLLADPGPIVIGATQGAACFGAAYEFLFNVRHQLSKHGLTKQAPITFVTAEPFLAHFGIGGFGNGEALSKKMFDWYKIDYRLNAVVEEVLPDGVRLAGGEVLPSKYTMLIPRFLGVAAVRNSPGLANANGFIPVNEEYRHPDYPEVFAAGVAVHVPPPGETPVPCGVPKTGWPSEQMAKVAAHNILVDLLGEGHVRELAFGEIEAYCIMDAGNMGMMILGDHMLGDRHLEFIIPGPQAHWAKLAFEKYFLFTRKHAWV